MSCQLHAGYKENTTWAFGQPPSPCGSNLVLLFRSCCARHPCWNLDILHFPTLEPRIQVDQPCIYYSVLLVKTRLSIMNAKKPIPTFCINRRIARTHVPFAFSDLWSDHCEGFEKNSRHTFSTTLFWPATRPQENGERNIQSHNAIPFCTSWTTLITWNCLHQDNETHKDVTQGCHLADRSKCRVPTTPIFPWPQGVTGHSNDVNSKPKQCCCYFCLSIMNKKKNQGPIQQKYKANVNTSRHNPKKKKANNQQKSAKDPMQRRLMITKWQSTITKKI